MQRLISFKNFIALRFFNPLYTIFSREQCDNFNKNLEKDAKCIVFLLVWKNVSNLSLKKKCDGYS